ncbi:MAG TPA: hypothetical protein PJ994_09030 [Tepidiformaceae bacterium]|nr:hypothetical protein [Tepidiformaceae bacterium]
MPDHLARRLERTNQLYLDLAQVLDPALLASRLGELPSNTIGAQLWCVVGARQSYARAARQGSWQGFSSPLRADHSPTRRLCWRRFAVPSMR